MAKTIESSCRLVKKGCTQIHKALQLLWGIAEGICRQLFFFENLILRLELVTCHFWWKAFAIASRLASCLVIIQKRKFFVLQIFCSLCLTIESIELTATLL